MVSYIFISKWLSVVSRLWHIYTYIKKSNIQWVKVLLLFLHFLWNLDHTHFPSAVSPRSFHEHEEIFTCTQNSDTKIMMRLLCLFHWALNPPMLADNHIKVHVAIPNVTQEAFNSTLQNSSLYYINPLQSPFRIRSGNLLFSVKIAFIFQFPSTSFPISLFFSEMSYTMLNIHSIIS